MTAPHDQWDSWESEAAAATVGPGTSGALTAIVEPDDAARARLVSQFDHPVLAVTDVMALRAGLAGAPTVIVLGPGCAGPGDLQEVGVLLGAHPEAAAVLLSVDMTPEVFRHALRVGIRDVLPSPAETDVLSESVARVAAELVIGFPTNGPPSAGEAEAVTELGRVITVFSTKGGAGKSVLASNLAVVLARRSPKPVVLVDADLQFGDVAIMTRLAPQHTIVDAVDNLERLDAALLQSLLVRHEPSGMLVLAAPLEPQFADRISAADVLAVLAVLRTFAGHIVVDTPATFNDVVLGVIEQSDDVLLVAGMDVPNIKNVKIGLQTLRLLDTPASKLHLVLNRADAKVKLDVGEVERTLQLTTEGRIPSDMVVPQSVNNGTPVVLHSPRSGVAKAIEAIADLFLPVGATKGKAARRGLGRRSSR